MPALRQIKSFHTLNAYLVPPETVVSSMLSLPHVSELHGGRFPHTYSRHHPYPLRIPSQVKMQHHANMNLKPVLPPTLLDTIKLTQDAAVNRGTRLKDASRLREFLEFCEGLGIKHSAALPAREDVLMAWASSYAGRLAGKTVSAKILAIRKEHERRDLIWLGGNRLREVLKGVEQLRPASSFRSKRAPVTISMLEDLNEGLNRSSGLDICIRAISLLSFFCQLRSGEILPPTQHLRNFNNKRHATFANIAESTAGNGACNLHLPWSKTQKG
jgi:hypothetical protein